MTTIKKYILSLACLMAATAANAAAGHIYDIRPYYDGSIQTGPHSSREKPMVGGETVRFAVRLACESGKTGQDDYKWYLDYIGIGSIEVAKLYHPFKIGIYVSGQLREARLTDGGIASSDVDYTDFIFEYTVQPGDFALPVVLALSDGKGGATPATGTSVSDVSYYVPTDAYSYWSIRNTVGDKANLWFGTWMIRPSGADECVNDYDLRGAGFYVKTVDFDSDWRDAKTKTYEGIWRDVREGSTKIKASDDGKGASLPSLYVNPAATNVTTLHVWCDNPDAVTVTNANEDLWYDVTMNLNKDGTEKATYRVLDVTVKQGIITNEFSLFGVSSNKTANLILSANTNYTYNSSGIRYDDYISVPVRCVEKAVKVASVSGAVNGSASVDVGSDYKTPVRTFTVTATTGYTNDLKITVTPRLRDGYGAWSNYVHVAEEDEVGTWATLTPCTVTIPKSEIANEKVDTVTRPIQIYAMGADGHTADAKANAGIVFDITLESDAAKFYGATKSTSILYFNATPPVIAKPTEGQIIKCTGNTEKSFEIKVTDSYLNSCNTNVGYQIWYKKKATDNAYKQLKGTGSWAIGSDGYLRDNGGRGSLPSILYVSEASYETEFYVVAPDETTRSDVRKVTVVVSAPERVWMEAKLDDMEGNEGTNVNFTVHLSVAAESDYYAFLVPQDEASSNLVSCTYLATPGNKGVRIQAGKSASTTTAKIKFLDGDAEGTQLGYDVVLLTVQTYPTDYDPDYFVTGFQSDTYTPTIKNVKPRVTEAKMRGLSTTASSWYTVKMSGLTIGSASLGVTKQFQFGRYEPGSIDLSITNEGQRFELEYNVKEANGSGTSGTLYGDPAKTNFTYTFNAVGQAEISGRMRDKDMMDADEWSEEFVFYVDVMDQPEVTLESDTGDFAFDEDNVGARTSKMSVTLSENSASIPLTVELTVKSAAEGSSNPGTLKLGGCTETSTAGVYTVTFARGQTSQTIYIQDADGTKASSTKGFAVTARVVTHETNPDGKYWDEVYRSAQTYLIIDNVPPTVTTELGAENSETNAFIVAIGENRDIEWSVDDILYDLGADGSTTNITVQWKSPNNEQTSYVSDTTNHTFTAKFEDPGLQTVTVTVFDKDKDSGNGSLTKTWYFKVQSSKVLVAYPVGPSKGTTTLASKYRSYEGSGEGHIWVRDATVSSVDMFTQYWNCKLSGNAAVYAWGYKVGAIDDGSLDGHDIPIGPTGSMVDEKTPSESCYHYTDTHDSFLYGWIKYGADEGGADTATFGKLDLESWDGSSGVTPGVYSPSLPTDADENGGYAKTHVEAIFAREYLRTDNMGDINNDGLPDLYVQKYNFGVYDETTGVPVSNTADQKDIAKYNADLDENETERPDYLPAKVPAIYAYFVPDISNATDGASFGTPFTAVLELRGGMQSTNAHYSALNDACSSVFVGMRGVKPDRVYEDPSTSPTSTLLQVEWDGFRHWCADNGRDPADRSVWNAWSPECPTSPVLYDSDTDGLSDGYEYYYWYRAHVGYYEGTNHVFLTGRRLVPSDPCRPATITSAEIELAMRPDTMGDHDVDTDNDGLSDFQEAALGTNPFDFDTDGDGLPDGWEVLRSQTDPRSILDGQNGAMNFDGDAMACVTIGELNPAKEGWYVVTLTNGVSVCSPDEIELAENESGESFVVAKSGQDFYDAWLYETNAYCRGRHYLNVGTYTNKCVVGAVTRQTMKILHFHVYQMYGFDPRTGWNKLPAFTGHYVNTAPFTARDEYLLQAFFLHAGGLDRSAVDVSGSALTDAWLEQTTCPVAQWTATSGETEKTFYGADTDGDGMPDGWELYVMAGEEIVPDPLPANYDTLIIERARPDSYYSPLADYAEIVGTTAQNVNVRPCDSCGSDSLLWTDEFNGMESCAVYSNTCPTVVNSHPEWKNKWWPTDPWNADTDGDGLSDSEELAKFVYGDSEHTSNAYEDCVPGGGLNPLSWDTDCDGLPDPWEAEFAGSYASGTSSTTVSVTPEGVTNSTVSVDGAGWKDDGMDGTTDDCLKDYDHDGLANWQEYMVGAMRCWRYDDTVSPWVSHKTADPDTEGQWAGYITTLTDDDLYAMFENYWGDGFNPGLRNEHFDLGVYFSCARNAFEQGRDFKKKAVTAYKRTATVYGHFYMFKDGVNHDLSRDYNMAGDNRFTANGGSGASYSTHDSTTGKGAYPRTYICCSPVLADTDSDGMDDYYEIFHGLNPLLGKDREWTGSDNPPRDVVYEAYLDREKVPAPWSALQNYWLDLKGVQHQPRPDRELAVKGVTDSLYDFFQFPWLAGLATADPDGDNIRNQQEGIMANMQAAATYLHTDPTPLWMTDSSYADSLTYRYYQVNDPAWARSGYYEAHVLGFKWDGPTFTTSGGTTYALTDYPWLDPIYDSLGNIIGYSLNYRSAFDYWDVADSLFDFEEDEGYDSDHDFLSDFEEGQGKTKSASDPQYHDDPLRRQAMWFGGDDDKGFLQTPTPVGEQVPTTTSAAEVRQNFLYFTVECWAKADSATVGRDKLQTLVERAIWSGAASAADENYLRKNFLIGIKGGRWYAKFDSTGVDKLQAVEITEGPVASTDWTHVAATYDGTSLRLYVDGVCRVTKPTSIQPEHGVEAVTLNESGEIDSEGKRQWTEGRFVSILVGASAASKKGVMFDYQWQSRDIAYVTAENPMGLASHTTMAKDYDNFFRGYVDEVRIWDGARDAADILSDVQKRTRYDTTLAQANREEVFAAWVKGARRAPHGNGDLPPELMYHWSFDHIAGAVKTDDVIAEPAGFAAGRYVTDAMAPWARPVGWTNCWRCAIDDSLKSKVYDNEAWVPWINDTVGHLPRYDLTTLDSVYWSANYAGSTPAAEAGAGYSSFAFPRSAELPSRRSQMQYDIAVVAEDNPYCGNTRWELAKADDTMKSAYRFAHRNRELEGFDLLPFGGAYPKRIGATEGGMWDDGTAADAWAETGPDANNDGLPDWWTQYALENYNLSEDPTATITWGTTVLYKGIRMAAYQAYKRDLAKGMLSDREYHPEYEDTRDLDGDGMPDWWEGLYGIDTNSKTDAAGDPDHDGLSNFQEYKASEVDGRYMLNPTLANSITDFGEVDYFLRITNETDEAYGQYLGEVYADHDFMEDDSEDDAGLDRTRYDAYSDSDEDGWSAFSEMRYSNFKMGIAQKFLSHLVGEEEVKDFPIPVIHAVLRYNGDRLQSGSNATIVVQAYSGNSLQKEANAVYSIRPGTTQTRTQILGGYSTQAFHGTLTPGNVIAGEDKIKLEILFVQPDDVFAWTINSNNTFKGTYEEMYAAYTNYRDEFQLASQDLTWASLVANGIISYTDDAENALQMTLDKDTQKGRLLLLGKEAGTIDFTTGDFSLDLSSIGDIYMEGSKISLSQCFFRLSYTSLLPTLQTQKLAVSLATPDTGKLTEGTTAFSAYIDLDGDGFTPEKDPIGFVRDVEIGWDQVPELTIEMTDSSQAAGARFATPATNTALRIVRTGVNGSTDGVTPRIVYSTTLGDSSRGYVFEADHVTSGKYGLDWENLRADLLAMEDLKLKDVTSVDYTVTLGEGSLQNISEDRILTTFSVEYDSDVTKPACYSPSEKADVKVETQRPTFKWTAAAGYTCFRLQVRDEKAKTTLYESQVTELPACDGSGLYCWQAPLYIGTNVTAKDRWVLDNHRTYKWRVAMYNAKFSATEEGASAWSDWATMKSALADANDFSTKYGTVQATVRYFGPATNELKDVIVQLYRTADLSGTPAAQTRLFDTEGTAKDLAAASRTVSFHGLAAGDYYAAAFIDRNGDGTRQRYETWGYAAQVGLNLAEIWRPVAVTADATTSKIPSVEIYMEDTDVNGDDILDWNQDEAILKAATTSTTSSASDVDSDGDGLTDYEELYKSYTKSSKWDTDGDGMPDGWEYAFAGTDQLTADADKVTDGDWMAYCEITRTAITVRSTDTGLEKTYLVRDGQEVPNVGDNVNGEVYDSTYDYNGIYGLGREATVLSYELYQLATVSNTLSGAASDFLFASDLAIGVGTNVNEETAWTPAFVKSGIYQLGAKTNFVSTSLLETNLVIAVVDPEAKVSLGSNRVVKIDTAAKVALVHAQVYDYQQAQGLGYGQKTAISGDDAYTKAFTAIDKYLLVRYFEAIGLGGITEDRVNREKLWSGWSLKPGVIDGDWGDNKYGDGIADGWELYVMFGPATVTNAVSYSTPSATKINPWKYDDRTSEFDGDGLGLLGEYNRGTATMNPWNAHTLNEQIGDLEAHEFNIASGETQLADDDNDGLSNWAEYLLVKSGVFLPATNRVDDAYSVSAFAKKDYVIDYFQRARSGKYAGWYAGELYDETEEHLVADHDFIEDWWEDQYPIAFASRYVYDFYSDADGDGWSNWSEARAGTDPTRTATLGVDNMSLAEYPTPMIKLNLNTDSEKILDASIVIQAWRSSLLTGIPDAMWTTKMTETATASESGDSETTETSVFRYLGVYQNKVVKTYLSPGSVTPGSVEIQFKDLSYSSVYDSDGYDLTLSDVTAYDPYWVTLVTDKADPDDQTKGTLIEKNTLKTMGSIDYLSGEVSVNLAAMEQKVNLHCYVDETHPKQYRQTIDPRVSYVKILYASAVPGKSFPATFYLVDANEASDASKGHLKEGNNNFLAFADLNGDGVYTAGEPFGFARNVKVGWDKVPELNISLSSYGTAMPRMELAEGAVAADRDFTVAEGTVYETAANKQRVKIVRSAINGKESNQILFNRVMDFTQRTYLTEADVIRGSTFALDWAGLASAAKKIGIAPNEIKKVDYRVVLGEGTTKLGVSNNVALTFFNTFDATRVAPLAVSPGTNSFYKLLSAQPTFQWTGSDSYTAYRIELAKGGTNASDVVWTSGVRALPALMPNGYSYAAPIYVGDTLSYVKTDGTTKVTPFEDNKEYFWRVAQYNAKFNSDEALSDNDQVWSAWAPFVTATDSDRANSGYGKVKADIRYYGNAANGLMKGTKSLVVVEAYETADFTGNPLARVHLAGGSLADLAKTDDSATHFMTNKPNAELDGLAPGDYYLLAYIDLNTNGTREVYEPWGYACQVGKVAASSDGKYRIWEPETISVKSVQEKIASAIVFIEDTDVNQNMTPDCLEDMSTYIQAEKDESYEEEEGGTVSVTDADGDGLSSTEEDEAATDAQAWDSDGDGMPDGWEYKFAGTDPTDSDDGSYAVAGDVMAYMEVKRDVIRVQSTATGAEAIYLVPEGVSTPSVGTNVNGWNLLTCYYYGTNQTFRSSSVFGQGSGVTVASTADYQLALVSNDVTAAHADYLFAKDAAIGVGTNVYGMTAWKSGGYDAADRCYRLGAKTNFNVEASSVTGTNRIAKTYGKVKVSLGENRIVEVLSDATVALVHAQVYSEMGFDPKTAVAAEDAVNTKAFTALDKYLVARYLEAIGLADEKAMNAAGVLYGVNKLDVSLSPWAQLTLKPGDADNDKDGIADGWELYTMFGPNVDLTGTVTASAVNLSPWDYDDARTVSPGDSILGANRCTNLMEYGLDSDGNAHPTDPYAVDTDRDSVTDYFQHLYHLWDSAGDADGDGLSNLSEYYITEVFGFAECDPDRYATPDATGASVCDYFKKVGDLYLGEIFQDHDRIDDAWERTYADGANASAYDAGRDDDEDGWSNWAEAKAGTNPGLTYSPSVDTMLAEYPIPTIKASVRYDGTLTGQMNFRAWSEKDDPKMLKTPSAAWASTTAATNTVKYVGRNPGKTVTYSVGTGLVKPGSVLVYFRDVRCEKSYLVDGVEISSVVSTDTPKWFPFIADDSIGTLWTVASTNSATANFTTPFVIGTVDYQTGAITIDYSKLPDAYYDRWDNGSGDTSGKTQGVSYNAIKVNLPDSFVRIEWTPTAYPTTGNETYYLNDSLAASSTCNGHIREGKNTFLVWCDKDTGTAGVYDPGEPMGLVQGVDVGWNGAEFAVKLSEMSGITPRFDMWSDSTVNDRSATMNEATTVSLTDRIRLDLYPKSTNYVSTANAQNEKVHVRIVRFGINHIYAYACGVGFGTGEGVVESSGSPDPIVIDRTYEKSGRSFLCEADFLQDGELDLDWSRLENEILWREDVRDSIGYAYEDKQRTIEISAVTNITYLAVLDGGKGFKYWINGVDDTNTVIQALGTPIERRFELVKHAPVAENVAGITYAARPTFRWSLPNEEPGAKAYGTTYTAFKLQIFDENGTAKIYDSGVRRAPAQNADGSFEWTAEASVCDLVSPDHVFAPTGKYKWRVAMYNAKFKPQTDDKEAQEKWSERVEFAVAVNGVQEMNDAGYSSIDAMVRYAGPSAVVSGYQNLSVTNAKVRVQAFATGDFAGVPLAEAVVTSALDAFNATTVNARLRGLPASGTYYLRAYIDSNGNHQLDDWESWGEASEPVTLTTATAVAPVASVWIEDSDTDQDWMPDAWEYAQFGNLTTAKADVLSDDKTIVPTTTAQTAKEATASTSSYLEGACLTIFENGSYAKVLLGWGSESGISFYDIQDAVRDDLQIDANTFRITSMAVTGNTLSLSIDAEVSTATVGSELLAKVYSIEKEKEVTIRILKKDSLAQENWETVDEQTVTFGAGEQTATVLIGQKLDSAFYKVEVVE